MIKVISVRLSEEDEVMLDFMRQYFQIKGMPSNYSVLVRYALYVAYQKLLIDIEE